MTWKENIDWTGSYLETCHQDFLRCFNHIKTQCTVALNSDCITGISSSSIAHLNQTSLFKHCSPPNSEKHYVNVTDLYTPPLPWNWVTGHWSVSVPVFIELGTKIQFALSWFTTRWSSEQFETPALPRLSWSDNPDVFQHVELSDM